MKKRFLTGIFSAMMAMTMMTASFANSVPVFAETVSQNTFTTENGVVDFDRGEASITISGNNASKSLTGKTFHLYQLFYAENAIGLESVNYTFNDACKSALQNVVGAKINKFASEVTEYEVIDYIQSLNNNVVEGANAVQTEEGYYSDFRYFVEDLRDELVNVNADAADIITVMDVNEDGVVVLQGLEYGYYIIDEVSNNAGTNSASSLCIVNTANPDSAVKVKSDYPSVVKKIQEDDNQDIVGNDGWNDMADYEIGQTVPYKFTSTVPDMNGYASYYYAWHDVMDEALTFHPESVEITISDGSQEYTLDSSEFTVTENVGDETFVIEIKDLKTLVDTEFDHLDDLGHNTYGQNVVLTYQATLNDKAAEATGLPGFQNDVRLEFSNDPDSTGVGKTGYTPWDSVVCYTYRLNGLKVNNHDKVLENAKFRLYLDEACTDEVYVKESEYGYIIMNADFISDETLSEAVEMSSDENGEFYIIGLDSGTYYLKETAAPAGYRTLLDPIKIDVKATFIADRNNYSQDTLIDLEVSAHVTEFLEGEYTENDTELITDVNTGTANLTVVNTVGSKLPVTGSSATLIMVGVGSALMLVSKGLGRKKKGNER